MREIAAGLALVLALFCLSQCGLWCWSYAQSGLGFPAVLSMISWRRWGKLAAWAFGAMALVVAAFVAMAERGRK